MGETMTRTQPRIADIQRIVAAYKALDHRLMRSKSRQRIHARPRQIAMYLARKYTDKSLPGIGREFGGRHHTTVLHAVRRVAELCSDPSFKFEVEAMKHAIERGPAPFELEMAQAAGAFAHLLFLRGIARPKNIASQRRKYG